MTQRVLLQGGASAKLVVSKPGIDATVANLDQTVFDSRWSGHQFYLSGTLDSINDSTAQLNFGETLDAPPFMLGYCDPSILLNPGAQYLMCESFRGGGTDFWIYAAVTTSSIVFRFKFGNQQGRLYFSLFRRIAG
ncbi:hypothetical protein AB7M45_007798 [Bradyrhizobium elkanii]|uniref:hypothetical protein n=1 Tax=Bradyrhizobium elkanii TaxID=29448 RepID=UPI000915CEC1|nr:hypothetical protein [Bradyrhizobium elkanii]MCW2195025.1 hypothetical protein [Bradyrhizobium elkanii]NWL67280.1 hypothetical protein [Bradyrhizobium elkanii]OIM94673.1 hypothetical protein BLN97_09385 [Bradyrhizobium elkanii]